MTGPRLSGLILLVLFAGCVSCSAGEEVTGVFSVKGTGSRSWPALTLSDGTVYRLTGKLTDELTAAVQNRQITVKGELTKPDRVPAEFEVTRIVSPDIKKIPAGRRGQ